jgi:carbon monoxide dehydrogenase subunit G
MTTFESEATINRPVNEVYLFLADMNNHQQLMSENVQDWSSTSNEARFNVQGMLKLALKIEDRVENQEIKIVPAEKPPFELELKWVLSSYNNQTLVRYTIRADLNMMMKIMASGPLQKLTDHEAQALAQILN